MIAENQRKIKCLSSGKDTAGKRERVIAVEELRQKYSLKELLKFSGLARSTFYYCLIIEGLNRQFRKITKNKPSFTNDDSLRKILYLASKNIVGHWSVTCRN